MPSPKPNETRGDFVARCYADPKAKRDFPDGTQRLAFCYSQFEKENKKSESFQTKNYDFIWKEYNKQRLLTEKKSIGKFYSAYKKEFKKMIAEFLETGNITRNLYFSMEMLGDLYEDMYIKTGLHFANWYANNIGRIRKKSDFQRQWSETFKWYSQEMTRRFGQEIANATTQQAIRTFERLMQDPTFASMGIDEKSRILVTKMNQQALIYASRVVLTETTRISNYAIHQSSLTFFNKEDLVKIWISALDGNERDAHREAHSRYVEGIPVEQDYDVGGELLARPGAGSIAANNVNCRCLSIDMPKPGAESIADIDDIGLGFGINAAAGN